ncbi:lysophospholipid acyltransferase family protein [Piscinibacter sakaiensis]|uniref:lysophospholipid acyltransferase family protein n=1 Tax=Piscinibacter sakaiensis TaxID=1547922 RepID=UPI003AAC4EEA
MAASPLWRGLRAVGRLSRTSVHVLHGLAITLLLFPRLDAQARAAKIRWWSLKVLRLMGVELLHHGFARPGAKLLVANHVSWMDILAIHAVCPDARFVSKSDVRRWPLLGVLVAAAGTLFIERERKRDALRVVHRMAEALQAGETVAIFPEGTTTDGSMLLPFHANLLQAAIASETPVQPVALAYADAEHPISRAVSFVGETTLVQSLWRTANAQQLRVSVQLLPARSVRHADRRRLALTLVGDIAAAINVPAASAEV